MILDNIFEDNAIKFEHSEVINSYGEDQNIVGSSVNDLRTLSFTPSNSNSVFVSKLGNDDTGNGTSANPYMTIQKAIDECTSSRPHVVIADSGIYYEQIIIRGSCDGVYAAEGFEPRLSLPQTLTRGDKILLSAVEAHAIDLGNPLSSPYNTANSYFFAVNGTPHLAEDGNFIIVYMRWRLDGSTYYYEIRLRKYNSTFTNIISDIQVTSGSGSGGVSCAYYTIVKDYFIMSYSGGGVSNILFIFDKNDGTIKLNSSGAAAAGATQSDVMTVKNNIWIVHKQSSYFYVYDGYTLKNQISGEYESRTLGFDDDYLYARTHPSSGTNGNVYKINLTDFTYTSNTYANLMAINSYLSHYSIIWKDPVTNHYFVICRKNYSPLTAYLFELNDIVNPTTIYSVIDNAMLPYINLEEGYSINSEKIASNNLNYYSAKISNYESIHFYMVDGESTTSQVAYLDTSKIKTDFGQALLNLTYFQGASQISGSDFAYMMSDWTIRRKTFDGTNPGVNGSYLINLECDTRFVYVGNNKLLVISNYSTGRKVYLKDLSDTDTSSYGTLFFNTPSTSYYFISVVYIPDTNDVIFSYYNGSTYQLYRKSITDTDTSSIGTAITTGNYDSVMYIGNSRILFRSRSNYNQWYTKSVSDVDNMTLFLNIANAMPLAYYSEENGLLISYNSDSYKLRFKSLDDTNTTNLGTLISSCRFSSQNGSLIANNYFYYRYTDSTYLRISLKTLFKNERFITIKDIDFSPITNSVATEFKFVKDYKMSAGSWSGSPSAYYNMSFFNIFDFDLIKSSVAASVDGLKIDINKAPHLRDVVRPSANIALKNCSILNLYNAIDLSLFDSYIMRSSHNVSIENCYCEDLNCGFDITSNAVSFLNNLINRCKNSTAIKITGAGSGIVLNHNTLNNNASGIELVDNNGSEVIKNSILHNNPGFGAKAETALVIYNSVCTDALTNCTLDDSCSNLNPLFKNEGLVNPAQLNLHVQTTYEGYTVNSPALARGDDNKLAGCYDVDFIVAPPTYESFYLPKPKQIEVVIDPVGEIINTMQDGSVDSSAEAFQLEITLDYDSIRNIYAKSIIDMIMAGGVIRIYFNPYTEPSLFEPMKIKYKNYSFNNKYFKHMRHGFEAFKITFVRKFERYELND